MARNMNIRNTKLPVFIAFLFYSGICMAQTCFENIDPELIQHKKIVEYLIEQKAHTAQNISDIKASCHSDDNFIGFRKHEKRYLIKDNISKVWVNYTHASPTESWDGKTVSFGILISKSNQKILYPGDAFQSIDTGQVVYLNLSLLSGFYELALAFEIIKIDEKNGLIEFSYVEGNKSRGIQRMKFVPTRKGNTRIIHSSYYKSNSRIRDKVFYPFFHQQATNEFHRNLKRKLKGKI